MLIDNSFKMCLIYVPFSALHDGVGGMAFGWQSANGWLCSLTTHSKCVCFTEHAALFAMDWVAEVVLRAFADRQLARVFVFFFVDN